MQSDGSRHGVGLLEIFFISPFRITFFSAMSYKETLNLSDIKIDEVGDVVSIVPSNLRKHALLLEASEGLVIMALVALVSVGIARGFNLIRFHVYDDKVGILRGFTDLFVCLFIYSFVLFCSLSDTLFVCLFVCFICLFVYTFCLFIYLFVCVCLFFLFCLLCALVLFVYLFAYFW